MKDPRRLILLIIAVTTFVISGTAIVIGGFNNIPPQWSIPWRASLLLGAVWLALPELSRLSLARSWPFLAGATVVAITLVVRPKLALFAVGAFAAILTVNLVIRSVSRALSSKQR